MTRRNETLKRILSWIRFTADPAARAPHQAHRADEAGDRSDASPRPAEGSTQRLRPVPQESGPLGDARLRRRISTVFAASQPVQAREGLCGRDRKLAELLDGVRYRRNHAVICGPRGSGKTSLARVFGDFADEDGAMVLYMAGSDDASFDELLRPYIQQVPEACCGAGMKQHILEAAEREKLTASRVVDLLTAVKYAQVIFILDEFDRITSAETKAELATLMKLTSDACLRVNYVIVGIAENLHELITGHASLRRHLTIVAVEPLADDAVEQILADCFAKCGLDCEPEATAMLTASSCGSPYHARLFGMHAALDAAVTRARRIEPQHVRAGLRSAFTEWRAANPVDAAAFEQIARCGGEDGLRIVRMAKSAAYRHADAWGGKAIRSDLPDEDGDTLNPPEALRSVLEQHNEGIVFRDSLAPQFLLIAMRTGAAPPANQIMEAVE